MLGAQHRTTQIDGNGPVEGRHVQVGQVAITLALLAIEHRRIVVQYVDAAEALLDLRDQVAHLILRRHVGTDAHGLAACRPQ